MELAPMTKRDKILLYFVLMVAFVVLYIRFLLIPGIENHQQAAADLAEAETAQTTMQDTILMASANAAQKNTNWGELQTANAVYYSLLSSDELDTLVTSLELNHNLQPESLSIGQPVTQNLGWYVASADAGRTAGPSAAADTAVPAGDAAATAEGVDWKQTYCFTMDSVMNGSKTTAQWLEQLKTDSAKLKAALN